MAERTQNFGLNKVTDVTELAADGYKFGDKDRDILDALLKTLMTHDHSGQGSISDPNEFIDFTIANTGGNITAGVERFYRFSFVDANGNETLASPERYVDIPDPIAQPDAPTGLTVVASGGFGGSGTFKYALGFYQTLDGQAQTMATNETSIYISSGTTNKIQFTLPYLREYAEGWNIYRKRPQDTVFTLYEQVAKGNDEVQEVYNSSTSGTFTLTFLGQTSSDIQYNANAATVRSILQQMASITSVTVTGAGTSGDPWVITFKDPGGNVPLLVADDSSMDGSSTITQTTAGTSLSYEDDLSDTVLSYTIRPTVNNTFSQNKVTLTIPSSFLPLDTDIASWKIYRSNNSGSFDARSLLAHVTTTDGGTAAQGTLTMDTQPTDGDTVTVDTKTYTFQNTLTNVDGNVKIGASLTATQQNLVAAFSNTGEPGTDYAVATVTHPSVEIDDFVTNNAVLTAYEAGVAGNSIVTTETFTAGTNVFDAATLGTTTAGVDPLLDTSFIDVGQGLAQGVPLSQSATAAPPAMRFPTAASAPSNPGEGEAYVDTTLNQFRIFAEGAWRNIGASW